MYPDATLSMIQDFLARGDTGCEVDHAVEDLRVWLAKGGFQPDWARCPLAESYYKSRMARLRVSVTGYAADLAEHTADCERD